MTLPSLPTDNLYKFLALAGLFLAVFGYVYPTNRLTELQIKQASIETEWSVLNVEMDRLKADTADVERSLRRLEAEAETEPTEARRNAAKISADGKKLRERLHELEIKKIGLEGKDRETKIVQAEISSARTLLNVCVVVGVLLTGLGFVSWYFRVQRLQDQQLKNSTASVVGGESQRADS